MWDEIRNLRRVDLEVREVLNAPERNWVIGWLVARRGVNGALWRGAQPRVSIEYDADVVSGAALFDMLESLGLHARPVGLAATRFAAAAAEAGLQAVRAGSRAFRDHTDLVAVHAGVRRQRGRTSSSPEFVEIRHPPTPFIPSPT